MAGDAAVDQTPAEAARETAQPAGPEPAPLTVTGADLPGAGGMAAAARAGAQPTEPGALSMGDQAALPAAGSIPGQTPAEVALQHQSFGSKVYHGVLTALAGAQDVRQTGIDANGKPIFSTTTMSPGAQWKKIIAGAMTGLAAGSQVKGPGSPMRAFGAGEQASYGEEIRQQQEQRQVAQQNFENERNAKMDNARMMLMSNQLAIGAFTLSNMKVEATQKDVDNMNTFLNTISQGGEGTMDLGIVKQPLDAKQLFLQHPEIQKAHLDGQVVNMPNVVTMPDGSRQIQGFHAAYVTKQWMDQRTDHPTQVIRPAWENGKYVEKIETVPKGGMKNSEDIQNQMANGQQSVTNHLNEIKTTAEATTAKAGAAESYAKAGEAVATTKHTNLENAYMEEHGEWPGTAGKAGVIDPEDMPATVDAAGLGHMTGPQMSALFRKNPGLAEQVNKKYPDFDGSKVDAYSAAYKKFIAGSDAATINSAGTSLKHLLKLNQFNTPQSHIIGTPDYRRYLGQAHIAAEELAKFYGGTGHASVSDTERYTHDLAGIGPGREKMIKTTVGDLGDKLDSYENEWANALPSKKWSVPMPGIDRDGMTARYNLDPDYKARIDAQVAARQQQGQAAPQQGAPQQPGTTPPPAAAPQLPAAALQQVKAANGNPVTFGNGQVWQMNQAGIPVQVK